MKYHIITYGCQMNKADSERIAAILESTGYKNALKMDGADLIVVNMCSVRQSAVDRVYGLKPKFKKLKTVNNKLKTTLTGCILKKDRKKFAKYFDYILSIKEVCNNYLEIQPKYSSFPIAYVPISNGCNKLCTYCVIPYTRGAEICRPVEEILSEVKNLISQNYKEIWLLGQNVNSYKWQDINFPKLLKMVNNIKGNFWIRFISPHPKDFSDELIEVIVQGKKISKEIHLPLQSGDDEILRKMNRNYQIKDYKNLVKKIRKKIPNVSLSTDIIVGFPDESKEQFKKTLKLVKEIGFKQAYVAAYSPRPGTVAAKLKDTVPSYEKKRRKRILLKMFE